MPKNRFLIAPYTQGQTQDMRPWMIPDQAFASMRNAYTWRGRVRKRFGTKLLGDDFNNVLASRLRVQIGVTNAVTGNFAGNIPSGVSGAVGQAFSIGTTIFTVTVLGNAALLSTGSATGTFDTTTGAVTVTGNNTNPSTPVFFYPALPVMGITQQQIQAINEELTIAFDTRFAYSYGSSGWFRLSTEITVGAATWTGGDADFFWGSNSRGATNDSNALYVTNNVDTLRYLVGTSWDELIPVINGSGDTVDTCRLVVPFKDRLVLLNTTETGGTFVNRARFSWNGDPTDAANGWLETTPGRGGYIDAPTKEAIVTCQLFKDRLIVYFESSTWELVYTGNEILPFRWQLINIELGAESKLSEIPFDDGILGVGNVGVHICNGASVARIDSLIPDLVFNIHNETDGIERVVGIRDYYAEMAYWTYPAANSVTEKWPDKVLVYNYKNQTWATNDDSFTCFGYFNQSADQTWAETTTLWEETQRIWNDPKLQGLFPYVLTGNQQGFTSLIDIDYSYNAQSMQITNITGATDSTLTIINNNLADGDFIYIDGCVGSTQLNGNIYQVSGRTTDTVRIDNGAISAYLGGGTVSRVSQIDIYTKMWNFFKEQGRTTEISKVDFNIDRESADFNDDVSITVDFLPAFSNVTASTSLPIGILDLTPYELRPIEQYQDQLWHTVYYNQTGATVQLRIFYSESQMYSSIAARSGFTLHAMCVHASPASYRNQ